MAASGRFSTAYLISGLCTGSLSFAFVANATAYGVAANAGALVRSMVPSFGLFTALLCVVTHITCSGNSNSSTIIVKRRQFYLAQLATTCVCLLLVVAGPALFAVTANSTYASEINCKVPGKTYRSILMDEIMLGAVMAGALIVCAILGWLDGGSRAIFSDMFGSRRNAGGLQPSGESGKAELSLESQEHRISAANKKRRPPTGVTAAATATAATAAAATTAAVELVDAPAVEGASEAQPAVASSSSADNGSNKAVKFADEAEKKESRSSAADCDK